jgi:hypothetical protein
MTSREHGRTFISLVPLSKATKKNLGAKARWLLRLVRAQSLSSLTKASGRA